MAKERRKPRALAAQREHEAVATEEQLLADVIIPWLQRIGCGPPLAIHQKTFQIQIGRGMFTLPRCDVLVTSPSGRPLFVVEAKRAGTALAASDARQVLSYARLTDPMAPLAILTNGSSTLVFDVYTGKPIDGRADWTTTELIDAGQNLQPSGDDIALRQDAISKLVALNLRVARHCSRELVKHFRKHFDYVRELHVERTALHREFEAFLDSDRLALFVTGEPDAGKSSSLIHLCEAFSEECVFLPWSFDDRSEEPLKGLAREFYATTSEFRTWEEVLKALRQVARPHGTRIVVLLDGVGDRDPDRARTHLDEITRFMATLERDEPAGRSLRLVCTFLTAAWQATAMDRGRRARFVLSAGGPELKLTRDRLAAHVHLADFNDTELDEALIRLRRVRGIQGIEGIGRDENAFYKSPALLRFLGDRYGGRRLPGRLVSKQVLDALFGDLKAKGGDSAVRASRKLMDLLIDEAADRLLSEVATDLLQPEEIQTLVQAGVCRVRTDREHRSWIGFRFGFIVRYVLVFHHFKLDRTIGQADHAEQRAQAHSMRSSRVKRLALGWYGLMVSPSCWPRIFEDEHNTALQHAAEWTRLMQSLPCVVGEGYAQAILVPSTDCTRPWLGVTRVEQPDPQPRWLILKEEWIDWPYNAARDAKVEIIGRFLLLTPDDALEHWVRREFMERLLKGEWLLKQVAQVPVRLASTLCWALASLKSKELNLPARPAAIGLDELRKGLDIYLTHEYLKEERNQRQFFDPQIQEAEARWKRVRFLVASPEPGEDEELLLQARGLVARSEVRRPRGNDRFVRCLERLIRVLAARGVSTIEPLVDPFPGARPSLRQLDDQGIQRLLRHAERIYLESFQLYRELIANCLPGIKDLMRTYIPHSVQIKAEVAYEYGHDWHLAYAAVMSPSTEPDRAEFNHDSDRSVPGPSGSRRGRLEEGDLLDLVFGRSGMGRDKLSERWMQEWVEQCPVLVQVVHWLLRDLRRAQREIDERICGRRPEPK